MNQKWFDIIILEIIIIMVSPPQCSIFKSFQTA
jgi:hypothetical protein